MWEFIAWMSTILGAVVVVLTRVRLSNPAAGAGRVIISPIVANAHFVVGIIALSAFIAYLVTDSDVLGIPTIVLWWIEAVLGLAILLRGLPSGGAHASSARSDQWGRGPLLSLVAHIGLLIGVALLTVLYLLDRI